MPEASSTIIICEKPSQARNLREALGNRYGEIFAARGHLLQLAEPHDVNPDWKKWSYDVLRPEGGFYPLCADRSDGKGEILDRIERALGNARTAIIATDCDREGQAIGENLLRFYKFGGEVFRAMFSAEDPDTLRTAFEKLEPNTAYLPLYQAAYARVQVDQIFNLTATRAVTLSLKPASMKGALGIGRVKTPTMAIVCRRETEIANFSPRDYFNPWIDATNGADTVRLNHRPSEEHRLYSPIDAEQSTSAITVGPHALKVEKAQKRQAPPKLMDLPTLQQRAAPWGWTAAKTLAVAQTLYADHKLTTYPRAENRYLPEVEIENALALADAICSLDFIPVKAGNPVIRKGVFSDAALKGASHHAVVPNLKTAGDWQKLVPTITADELKLFELIACSYLAAIMPDRIYDRTEFSLTFDKRRFSVSGIVDVDLGWKNVFAGGDDDGEAKSESDDEKHALPVWEDQTAVTVADKGVDKQTTKPPARYTEGSLIKAMQQAWRFAENPDAAERLKEAKGIGTPATRDSVIEGLKRQNFLTIQKNKLHASELAMALHAILLVDAPDFLDPVLTAEMELALDGILTGETNARVVVDDLVERSATLAGKMKARGAASPIPITFKNKPSPAMLAAARSKAKREGVKLPRGATSDSEICSAFLGPRPEGDTPSEKQVGFAQRIAAAMKCEIPDDARVSRATLTTWIDAHKDKLPAPTVKPPSEKQIEFAEKIAREASVELPAAERGNSFLLSKWIDKNMKKGGKRNVGSRRKR